MSDNITDTAVVYAEMGYRVFPCTGKIPIVGFKWQDDATSDPEGARALFGQHPDSNIGLVVSRSAVVIDCDQRVDWNGTENLRAIRPEDGSPLGDCPTALTGGGGLHFWYQCPESLAQIGNKRGRLPIGVDVRSGGRGYVIVPPSVHPETGRVYTWLAQLVPVGELPILPAWIAALLTPEAPLPRPTPPSSDRPPIRGDRVHNVLRAVCERIRSAPEGTRNETLNHESYALAGVCAEEGVSLSVVENDLHDAALQAGLSEHEIGATLASSLGAGSKSPLPAKERPAPRTRAPLDFEEYRRIKSQAEKLATLGAHQTDMGNVDRFLALHGDVVRFNTSMSWLVWTGTHWAPDKGDCLVTELAKQTVEAMHEEARLYNTKEQREAVSTHAFRSEKDTNIRAMLGLASRSPAIWRAPTEFDMDDFLLNVANGTLDLRTGELRPHRREDWITKFSPTVYERGASAPRWGQFLEEVLPTQELRYFVQLAAGYSLTGSIIEELFFVLYGTGQNGKSKFLDALSHAIGSDYTKKAPRGLFIASKNKQPADMVANLYGARMVRDSETGEGKRIDEEMLKDLSGEDKVSGCLKYKEPFDYTPTFKLWLSTNHRPRIQGQDLGIWRRLALIPFTVTIPRELRDKHLLDKLKAEASGILDWAATGAFMWCAGGLTLPDAVKVAVAEYRSSEDLIGRWIGERTTSDPRAESTSKSLFDDFREWMDEQGENTRVTQTKFGRELAAHGFMKCDTRIIRWRGISLPRNYDGDEQRRLKGVS